MGLGNFPALSYIQTIIQLVDANGDIKEGQVREAHWSCASDHRSVSFSPITPLNMSTASHGNIAGSNLQSRHNFDICMEPCKTAAESATRTNLDGLIQKAFEGFNVCILSMGIGEHTDEWRHEWMLAIMHQLDQCWKNQISSTESPDKDIRIEFSFCLLGMKDQDVIDYATLEILPRNSILDGTITLEDLLIQGESHEASNNAPGYLWALLRRPASLSCAVLLVHFCVENDSDGVMYNGSICLGDLGHYGGPLQNGLDSIKDLALLLQQPYISTDLPYDKHPLTFLMSEYLGGKGQSCLVMHVDKYHADSSSLPGIRFGELVRTIRLHPVADIEEIESTADQENSNSSKDIFTENQRATIQNLINGLLSSCEEFQLKIKHQESNSLCDKMASDLLSISNERAQRSYNLALYEHTQYAVSAIENEISIHNALIDRERDSLPLWQATLDNAKLEGQFSFLKEQLDQSKHSLLEHHNIQKELKDHIDRLEKEHSGYINSLTKDHQLKLSQQDESFKRNLSTIKEHLATIKEAERINGELEKSKSALEEQCKLLSTKLLSKEQELLQQQNHQTKLESEISFLHQLKNDLSEQLKQSSKDTAIQTMQYIKDLEEKMHKDRELYFQELRAFRKNTSSVTDNHDQFISEIEALKSSIAMATANSNAYQLSKADSIAAKRVSKNSVPVSKPSSPKELDSPANADTTKSKRKAANLARKRLQDSNTDNDTKYASEPLKSLVTTSSIPYEKKDVSTKSNLALPTKSTISPEIEKHDAKILTDIYNTTSFFPIAKPKATHPAPNVSDENTSFLTNLSFHQPEAKPPAISKIESQPSVSLRQLVRQKPSEPSSQNFFPSADNKASVLSNILTGFHVQTITPR
jgi:hypothetical protein